MKWGTVAVGLLVLGGCVSDRELVSDSLASRHYEAGRLAKTCCQAGTGVWAEPTIVDGKAIAGRVIACAPLQTAPVTCLAWKIDVNAFLDEIELASDAQKLGKLPKVARKRLKATKAQAEKEGEK